jgi:gamma-glutamyltranspeptidase / glutathione hydrolase
VTRDVARALASHWEGARGGRPEFARIFFPLGRPPVEGELLTQPELASTLELVAARGRDALLAGGLLDAVCAAVAADGGSLRPRDFAAEQVRVAEPAAAPFADVTVHVPPRPTSGAGVLLDSLARVDVERLGANRSRSYIDHLTAALAAGWRARASAAPAATNLVHTATVAAGDAAGAVSSLTFTHGEWFGSGIVVPGTGIVLNAGANLFALAVDGPAAVTNMSPIVVAHAGGTRHALGATGGPRIPAILLTTVVDVVVYGATLTEAIAAPHLAVRAVDGALQGEPALLAAAGREGLTIGPGDFGAATGVTRLQDGRLLPGLDTRFDAAAVDG